MKKRIAALSLSLCLLFALFGCGGNVTPSGPPDTDGTGPAETPAPTVMASPGPPDGPEVDEPSGRPIPSWAYRAVVYEVNTRQYTPEGTFKAFSEHLPRLRAMGINTLWFMPIHPISEERRKGTLGSYYSIADYYGVNPEFGTKEDFRELVALCHEMGFAVMMDWVANHTGWDHPWVEENPDWYDRDANGNMFYPYDWSDIVQLDFSSPALRAEMINAMKYWVTEFNVDGFRCDYPGNIPADFWEEARRAITEHKHIYMMAEMGRDDSFLEYAFDSYFGWDLFDRLRPFTRGQGSPGQLHTLIQGYETMPDGSFPFNFLDNHDKNSWEGGLFRSFPPEAVPALTALLFTLPGMPMIYSGQENGSQQTLAFFEKDEIVWDAPESLYYEELITALARLKASHTVLFNGNAGGSYTPVETGSDRVFAFAREEGGMNTTVFANLSGETQAFDRLTFVQTETVGTTLILRGNAETPVMDRTPAVRLDTLSELEPWGYIILTESHIE